MIDEQLRAQDHNNPLVPLVVGFIAWTDLLEAIFLKPDTQTAPTHKTVEPSAEILDALVGLFALREQLDSWLVIDPPSSPKDHQTSSAQPENPFR